MYPGDYDDELDDDYDDYDDENDDDDYDLFGNEEQKNDDDNDDDELDSDDKDDEDGDDEQDDGYGDDIGDGYGEDEYENDDESKENKDKNNSKDDEEVEVEGKTEGKNYSRARREAQYLKDAKRFGATIPVGMTVAGKCPYCHQRSIFKSKKAMDFIVRGVFLHQDVYYCFNRRCKHSFWRAKFSTIPQGSKWSPGSIERRDKTNWLKLF